MSNPVEPDKFPWLDKVRDTVSTGISHATKLLPVEQVTRTLLGWFSVDDAQVAEILQKVRAELPTTEALLVGKPQTGKSSIVRGLTGVSADIIGQGFRPHTRYTQQYFYPTADLPLLIFTDTVGLGDGTQETSNVIRELVGELQEKPSETRAKVLILTVKINDFATDTLKQIATRIRQEHPEVPCLLAVTCLHELYPPEVSDHPGYPPEFADLDRAFTELQKNFKGVCDRAVLIDFTLEEDEFHPTFYGLEALVDGLAELLPEAEARTISQLLTDRDAGKQISDLYRDAARRYILPFSVMAGALAAIPLPLATMPVLTALQVSLVGALGQLYGQTLTPSQAGGVVSAIAGGFVAQAIGRELIKFIPGFGSVIAASWASAYTWALGEAACVYFGDLLGGKKPDPKRIQAAMNESFELAKQRFKGKSDPEH
jgi:uncharacterized protein (DUF697 family)/predicted GTPase